MRQVRFKICSNPLQSNYLAKELKRLRDDVRGKGEWSCVKVGSCFSCTAQFHCDADALVFACRLPVGSLLGK